MKYVVGIIVASLLLIALWYTFLNEEKPETSESTTKSGELMVVTSFYPLQFALERIVGDLGTVVNIGEGKDPHDFEPTTQNILAMQKSDVVILQGAGFEHWGDDVIARLEADGVPVIIATEGLKLDEDGHDEHNHEEDSHEHEEDSRAHEDEDDHDEHNHGLYNPHTWLDPVLMSESVSHIADQIAQLDPDNAKAYEVNAERFKSELALLDSRHENKMANCELDGVITSHDAFSYVAKRYGFEAHSIAGISTQDTPSATTLASLKEEAQEGIEAILLEENSITAYGETLARETGLKTLSINPIAYIIPEGEDYLTLMQSNLNTFTEALKCNE